jgi:hypothetical protein
MNKEENFRPRSKRNSGLINYGQTNVEYKPDYREPGIPLVTLSNGLRVANFSSPHCFEFNDGTILPACSPERAGMMALNGQEVELENVQGRIQFVDILLRWEMSEVVRNELSRLSEVDGYDILLIPLPVMTAVKERSLPIGRCRCIRMEDRVKKLCYIDRFCI